MNFIKSQQSIHFNHSGELEAYNDMILDIDKMTEDEFVNKYLKIVKDIELKFSLNGIISEEENHKMGGYSNGVVNILLLINPLYEEKLSFWGYCSDELIDRIKE